MTYQNSDKKKVKALMRINEELANEVKRLNRVISILTGPIRDRGDDEVLLWKQNRTRRLEEIYLAVAEAKDGEVN